MAQRSPADVSPPPNYYGCDWFERYRGWNCQQGTPAPKPVTSGEVYGHGGATPYTAEFPPVKGLTGSGS
ncbi:hypothetical protein [Microbispora sp. NPDC049633]|uniref:hypothetical protein n=1 Tax=Microbispora sp. NPDC049633 TaxID=3154355 RepID=UPI00341792EE